MEPPEIIESVRLSDGVLVTFSDGKVALLRTPVLYALAVDPDTLPPFFKNDDT